MALGGTRRGITRKRGCEETEREEGIEEHRQVDVSRKEIKKEREREGERERDGCRGFVCIIAVIMGVSVRPV